MPTPADQLTPDSSEDAIKEGISGCIETMSKEHSDWESDRVAASCYSMARRATGKSLGGVREKKTSRV